MIVSSYSFLTSLLWFNLFIIFLVCMRKRTAFIANFSLTPLLFLVAVCFFRICFFAELSWTTVLPSATWFPVLQEDLTAPLFLASGITITPFLFLLLLWLIGFICFMAKYLKDMISLRRFTASLPLITDPHILNLMGEVMDEELFNILRHEWMHYCNNDVWFKLFAYLIRSVFWWNPFVYILMADLNHILEIKCDLFLSAAMNESEKIAYLLSIKKVIKHRLTTEKLSQNREFVSASALVSPNSVSKVEQRFLLVLEHNSKGHRKLSAIAVYGLILSLLFFSYSFVIQPASPAPSTQDGFEIYSVSAESSYLTENGDGTYSVYIDGRFKGTIEHIDEPPFSEIPVYEK